MNDNMMYQSIDTDRELYTILSNFSQESIENSINEALMYKFRPFNNRMPNLPYIIKLQFQGIVDHMSFRDDSVYEKELEVYNMILNKLCESYNLQVGTEIPDEQLYSLVYILYQILISEYTERSLSFYSNYIAMNKDQLLAAIPVDKRVDKKVSYGKKVYNDPSIVALYDNFEIIMEMVASLDISFIKLMEFLSDINTASFIGSYIVDTGDIYKNHFANYLYDEMNRTNMITSIKLSFLEIIKNDMSITDVNNNPYLQGEEVI